MSAIVELALGNMNFLMYANDMKMFYNFSKYDDYDCDKLLNFSKNSFSECTT